MEDKEMSLSDLSEGVLKFLTKFCSSCRLQNFDKFGMKIAIIPHPEKKEALALAKQADKWLKKKGVETQLVPAPELRDSIHPDIALIFGGDGLLVHNASYFADRKVPVLGINAGAKGVLTMAESKHWEKILEQVVKKKFSVEKRLMLEVLVEGRKFLAANDVYLRHPIKIILITLRVNKELLYRSLPGDGVIVTTPMGSTAYNQSAGGPIIKPGVKCIVITPICPDNINVKPVVCEEKDRIEIVYQGTKGESKEKAWLVVDGEAKTELKPQAKIEVKASQNHTYFAILKNYSFFKALQKKLGLSK